MAKKATAKDIAKGVGLGMVDNITGLLDIPTSLANLAGARMSTPSEIASYYAKRLGIEPESTEGKDARVVSGLLGAGPDDALRLLGGVGAIKILKETKLPGGKGIDVSEIEAPAGNFEREVRRYHRRGDIQGQTFKRQAEEMPKWDPSGIRADELPDVPWAPHEARMEHVIAEYLEKNRPWEPKNLGTSRPAPGISVEDADVEPSVFMDDLRRRHGQIQHQAFEDRKRQRALERYAEQTRGSEADALLTHLRKLDQEMGYVGPHPDYEVKDATLDEWQRAIAPDAFQQKFGHSLSSLDRGTEFTPEEILEFMRRHGM